MSEKKSKKYLAKKARTEDKISRPATPSAAAAPVAASPLFDRDNPVELVTRVFLIAMAIVFPLAMGSEKYANITHFKNMTFYLIAAAAFCTLILIAIRRVMKTPAYEFTVEIPELNAVDIAVLVYWGVLLLSTLFSPYKDVAFNGQGVRNDGFIIQTFYVVTYFVLSRLLRLQKFDLNLYALGATIVSVLVMFHFFGKDVLGTGFTEPNWESKLLFMGPMGNINLTSYFVTTALTVLAAVYVTEQMLSFDRHGYLTLFAFILMLWAELNLNTDAGLVALLVVLPVAMPLLLTDFRRVGRFFTVLSAALGVILFNKLLVGSDILGKDFGESGWYMLGAELVCVTLALLIHDGTLRLNPSRRTLLIATLSIDGIVLLGVLIAAAKAADGTSKGFLYEFGQVLFHRNFNDHFGTNRFFTWKRTLRLVFVHRPSLLLLGAGPDTFCNTFNEVFGDEAFAYFNGRNLDKAHNEYLQLLACSGLPAVGAFLAFLGAMVVKAFRKATDSPLLVCCALGVVAYAVHAFFGYSLPINSPLMWVLFGLTGAAVRAARPDSPAAAN